MIEPSVRHQPLEPGFPLPRAECSTHLVRRIDGLPVATRRALLVAAAEDTRELSVVLAAAQPAHGYAQAAGS
jgi:hypothetical protein